MKSIMKDIKKARTPIHISKTLDILNNLEVTEVENNNFIYKYNKSLIIKTMYELKIILVNEYLFLNYNVDEMNDIRKLINNYLKLEDEKIVRHLIMRDKI